MTLRDMLSMYEGGAHAITIVSANKWSRSTDAWASDILADEVISEFLDANVVSWSGGTMNVDAMSTLAL